MRNSKSMIELSDTEGELAAGGATDCWLVAVFFNDIDGDGEYDEVFLIYECN